MCKTCVFNVKNRTKSCGYSRRVSSCVLKITCELGKISKRSFVLSKLNPQLVLGGFNQLVINFSTLYTGSFTTTKLKKGLL